MPQLEISTYMTQIFWLITTFISFWLIMAKIIVPKIEEMVELRKRKYNDYILKAEEINKKALSVIKRYEEAIAVAKAGAGEQIAQNEKELDKFIARTKEDIDNQLKQKIEENEKILEKEKADTLKKIDVLSQGVADMIVKKLEIQSISPLSNTKISKKG